MEETITNDTYNTWVCVITEHEIHLNDKENKKRNLKYIMYLNHFEMDNMRYCEKIYFKTTLSFEETKEKLIKELKKNKDENVDVSEQIINPSGDILVCEINEKQKQKIIEYLSKHNKQ